MVYVKTKISILSAVLIFSAAGSLRAADLSDLSYEVTGDDTVTVTDCDTAAAGELLIPETIEGKAVTAIGTEAFRACGSLTIIILPDSVTSIGYYAFSSCTGLTSFYIPPNVTSIGDEAFFGLQQPDQHHAPRGRHQHRG